MRRPAWLARLTGTTQSERFDLDCRRELLHARTNTGTISLQRSPCPRPLPGGRWCAQATAQRLLVVLHAEHTAVPAPHTRRPDPDRIWRSSALSPKVKANPCHPCFALPSPLPLLFPSLSPPGTLRVSESARPCLAVIIAIVVPSASTHTAVVQPGQAPLGQELR